MKSVRNPLRNGNVDISTDISNILGSEKDSFLNDNGEEVKFVSGKVYSRTPVISYFKKRVILIVFVCAILALGILGYISLSGVYRKSGYHVALIGDSLFNHPVKNYDLIGKIKMDISNYNINFDNYAVNGYRISEIRNILGNVISFKPDAVLLFWGSDCDEVDEGSMTQSEIITLRQNYVTDLKAVIERVLSINAYMAIASPLVIGEGDIELPSNWRNKTAMLEDYRNITRIITTSYGVVYIDMRQAFLDASPPANQSYWKGYLTDDGIHESEQGTIIVAREFAKVLTKWFNGNIRNITDIK